MSKNRLASFGSEFPDVPIEGPSQPKSPTLDSPDQTAP